MFLYAQQKQLKNTVFSDLLIQSLTRRWQSKVQENMHTKKKNRSAGTGLVSSATQEQSTMKVCMVSIRNKNLTHKDFSTQSLHPGDIRNQGKMRGGNHAVKKSF